MIHPEVLALLPIAAYGALGALVAAVAKTHRIELPRVVRHDGDGGEVTLIDLGFLGAPLLGAVAAVMADGGPRVAVLYGAVVGLTGPAILNTILEPLLHKLGLPAAGLDDQGKGRRRPRPGPAGTAATRGRRNLDRP